MDRVNLIPDDLVLSWHERLLGVVDRRFLPVLFAAVGMVLAGLAWIAMHEGLAARRYTTQAQTLQAKQKTLSAELESANAYLAQLGQAEQQLSQQLQWLTQRVQYLNTYRSLEGEWASTLQDIKRALPYGVWLTELEAGLQGQLRLAGGAFSNTLVSQFMSELKGIPRFTNVAFSFTRQDKIGKTDVMVFELTCQVMPTTVASPTPVTSPKKS